MQRFSRKRQLIIDYLLSTDTHPTAEEVYEAIKSLEPDISLATVYRNLSELSEAGVIRRVGTVSGQERYDGDKSIHPHVVCSVCGKVCDIEGIDLPGDIMGTAANKSGFEVCDMSLRFTGICPECLKK